MKKAQADTVLKVMVNCPNCGKYQDVFENVVEDLDNDLRGKNMDCKIKCEKCTEPFIVDEVHF